MHHRYVYSRHLKAVDFDRASFLMDQDLLNHVYDEMRREMFANPRPDADYGLQWIWERYASSHFERFGQQFQPDADPEWAG